MRSNGSKQLYQYWERLRQGRQAPERGEIEPSDIRELLGDTFILEINNELKTISYRLAGTRLCSIYGRELKGYGYLGLWDEEHNLSMIRCVNKTHMDYTPVIVSHTGHSQTKRSVNFETLLLPLLPTADGSARILGVSSLTEEAPFWLGSDILCSNSIVKIREINTPVTSRPVEAAIAPRIKDLRIEDRAESKPVSEHIRGHLRVIDGGKSD